jgi:flavin reductase (DIM6/NTAB) family NADH-FMN oxidoreductase RutF
MIRVGDDQREAKLRSHMGQQVEQCDRIGTTRNRNQRRTRGGKQPGSVQVNTKSFTDIGHIISRMHPDTTYQLLRNLTSPVVAITARRGAKINGMISDSAVRASIVPTIPRVSVYIHKFNFTHDMVFETGRFVMHLLHRDQFDLIHRLGFRSGRSSDKLAAIPYRASANGIPILSDCYAHFECQVANVMDTGSSTCFLGDVVAVGLGAGAGAGAGEAEREVMTAAYFRANMPDEWRREYEEQLHAAQQFAAERSRDIRSVEWRAPKS